MFTGAQKLLYFIEESVSHLLPQVFVSGVRQQQVSDWLCTCICGGGVKTACWDSSFPPDPSLDKCGLLKLVTVQLTNSILHRVNEGRADVRRPSRDTLCASACASDTINCVYL